MTSDPNPIMRALLDEVKALRHDIASHVQITSDQAEEIDLLRQGLAQWQERWASEQRAEQRKRGHYD